VNGLALCAGIGGLELGVKLAIPSYRTIGFVERELFACEVLAARMEEGRLDVAPIWSDIESFPSEIYRGKVDLVTAGFPCQPVSLAGKQLGQDDERWLWPTIVRILREVRPRYAFFENVPGLLVRGGQDVLRDLASLFYDAEGLCLRAADVGASHIRNRVFVLASRHGEPLRIEPEQPEGRPLPPVSLEDTERSERGKKREHGDESRRDALSQREEGSGGPGTSSEELAYTSSGGLGELRESSRGAGFAERRGAAMADADSAGLTGERIGRLLDGERTPRGDDANGRHGTREDAYRHRHPWPPGPQDDWSAVPEGLEPALRRVAHGHSRRMDRLRALGNGVVPQQAAFALRSLIERMKP